MYMYKGLSVCSFLWLGHVLCVFGLFFCTGREAGWGGGVCVFVKVSGVRFCAMGYGLLVHVLCVSTPHVEARGYEHGGGWWLRATGF
jgi:hypothetical protein